MRYAAVLVSIVCAGCGGGGISQGGSAGELTVVPSDLLVGVVLRDSGLVIDPSAPEAQGIATNTLLMVSRNQQFNRYQVTHEGRVSNAETDLTHELLGHHPQWQIFTASGTNVVQLSPGSNYHVYGVRPDGTRQRLTSSPFRTADGPAPIIEWQAFDHGYALVYPFGNQRHVSLSDGIHVVRVSGHNPIELVRADHIELYEDNGRLVAGEFRPNDGRRPNEMFFRSDGLLKPNQGYFYKILDENGREILRVPFSTDSRNPFS